LDRLLEDERLTIEGISGTSSGTMNAVAVAHGLTFSDRQDARRTLAEFWNRIGAAVPAYSREPPYKAERTLASEGVLALSPVLSPYQLSPLDVDLLREIITDLFEFERLRKECRQRLYTAAKHVRTGKLRCSKPRSYRPTRVGLRVPAGLAPRRDTRR